MSRLELFGHDGKKNLTLQSECVQKELHRRDRIQELNPFELAAYYMIHDCMDDFTDGNNMRKIVAQLTRIPWIDELLAWPSMASAHDNKETWKRWVVATMLGNIAWTPGDWAFWRGMQLREHFTGVPMPERMIGVAPEDPAYDQLTADAVQKHLNPRIDQMLRKSGSKWKTK